MFNLVKVEGWVVEWGVIVVMVFEVGVWIGSILLWLWVSGWLCNILLLMLMYNLFLVLICCFSGIIKCCVRGIWCRGVLLDWVFIFGGWMLLLKF